MSSSDIQARLGQTLVDFSSQGIFPGEEAISAATLEDSALPAALAALEAAKTELEQDIRQISHESAPDVDSWITNAKSLQDDIEASRRLAGDIIQKAIAEESREEIVRDKEIHTDLLSIETAFNAELLAALQIIQEVNDQLDKTERLIEQRRVLDALQMLEYAQRLISDVPADKSTRVIRLLEQRSSELRGAAREHLMALWDHLILVDHANHKIIINQSLPSEPGNLDEVVTGLKAYKELDQAALKLWEGLERVIFAPRTDAANLSRHTLPSIQITKNTIGIGTETVQPTIKALFSDLEASIRFLNNCLPPEILIPLSQAMMPSLSIHIKEAWLEAAVPYSLEDMTAYQKALAQVDSFAESLHSLEWPGVDSFNDWVTNAPKIWLAKRRENHLDRIRNGLSLGVGVPQSAKRVETRMVEKEEATATNQDWDSAWTDEDHDVSTENGSEAVDQNGSSITHGKEVHQGPPDDDAADAWGWGDEEEDANPATVTEESKQALVEQPAPGSPRLITPDLREVTVSEKYWVSSLPQPILKTVIQVFNDGAELLRPENNSIPVAPAAAALFVLPTLFLALYRSVGPLYYGLHPSGNLFLYNDTLWLADQLRDFVAGWKGRDDLPPRAIHLVRLDTEIAILESFGKRAYANELNSQRTIISDLLGGTQNFFQDDSSDEEDLKARITIVIGHIRSNAASWEKILSPSALSSSLGSLVNAVATRLISDIFDMTSMSVAEAESTATIISLVEKLDDLFLPPKEHNGDFNGLPSSNDPIPLTAQFADQWMKMKYLSQTLQSNLSDIRYLWLESELSLYCTVQEVVELIQLSFENNTQVRNQIRQIRENPQPISNV